MNDESERDKVIDEIGDIEGFVQKLVDETEKALRKELKLPEVKIKKWKKTNGTLMTRIKKRLVIYYLKIRICLGFRN